MVYGKAFTKMLPYSHDNRPFSHGLKSNSYTMLNFRKTEIT